MPNIFYREDDRDLADLPVTGFEAWVQLGMNDITTLVTRFNDISTADVVLTEARAKWIAEAINSSGNRGIKLNINSLGQLIKSKVDTSTIQISTGITQDGGGRSKKHLFSITVPAATNLYMVDAYTGIYTQNPASFKVMVKPKLVMDAPLLANATLVAIAIVGGEVSFLTGIPLAWIAQLS